MSERFAADQASGVEVLYQAFLHLHASLALPVVLEALVRAANLLIADLTSIRIFVSVEDRLTFGTAWWSSSPPSTGKAPSRVDELVHRAANTGQMVSGSVRKSGAGASMMSTAVPLKVDERVVGVLAYARPGEPKLPKSTCHAIQLLAGQAALAINNALLFEKVSQQAHTDSLTGLPNRRAFDMRLEEETRRSSRYQHTFSLIMFDVDGFKEINDVYGHPVGDQFLQHVIGCLRAQLRETDFFARFGGDEFAIILPETDVQIAYRLARRLEEVAEECAIQLPDGARRAISISVGLAAYPAHAISASALIVVADQALYRAKKMEDVFLDNS